MPYESIWWWREKRTRFRWLYWLNIYNISLTSYTIFKRGFRHWRVSTGFACTAFLLTSYRLWLIFSIQMDDLNFVAHLCLLRATRPQRSFASCLSPHYHRSYSFHRHYRSSRHAHWGFILGFNNWEFLFLFRFFWEILFQKLQFISEWCADIE